MPEPSIQTDALPDAMLLAATGGLLDAVVYLNHGHVFANAMTGNVIFLAIAAIGRDWLQSLRHIVPIAAFLAGVATSKHVRYRLGPRAVRVGLLFEITVLFLLGALPHTFPQMAFTASIAYVAAFQVASFRIVDRFSYATTFITGNLRDIAEGAYESARPSTREQGRSKALDLSLICLCFLAGALIGAWAAPRFTNHSLWLTEPFLILVTINSTRRPGIQHPS